MPLFVTPLTTLKQILYRPPTDSDKIPLKEILVIGCDFNTRICTRLNNSEWVIGNHGLGDRCINRVRLLMFAMLNNLSVANTWFKHKPCHTYTWRSRDARARAKIDYLLVSCRFKSRLKTREYTEGRTLDQKVNPAIFY